MVIDIGGGQFTDSDGSVMLGSDILIENFLNQLVQLFVFKDLLLKSKDIIDSIVDYMHNISSV